LVDSAESIDRNLKSKGPKYDDFDIGDAIRNTLQQETNKLGSGQKYKLSKNHKNRKPK